MPTAVVTAQHAHHPMPIRGLAPEHRSRSSSITVKSKVEVDPSLLRAFHLLDLRRAVPRVSVSN